MTNSISLTANGGGSFVGEKGVNVFVLTTLISGLRMYAKCGMMPNRMWTPSKMMKAAAHHTGKKFKARDYEGAAKALTELRDGVAQEVFAEMRERKEELIHADA